MSKLMTSIIDAQAALGTYDSVGSQPIAEQIEVTTAATLRMRESLVSLLDALVGEPGSPGHEIDELWAWVMLDDQDGNEGIPAYKSGNVMWPMVGADADRILQLREIAQGFANLGGAPITLRRFSQMEILETLEPTP